MIGQYVDQDQNALNPTHLKTAWCCVKVITWPHSRGLCFCTGISLQISPHKNGCLVQRMKSINLVLHRHDHEYD